MAHELIRYSNMVFNTPQLIAATPFRIIAEYLQARNSNKLADTIYQGTPGEGLETEDLDIFNGVGVIKLNGVMTYKPLEMMCAPESTSYLELIEDVQEMCDAGVKAIIFECSSGGGAASHMFETADKIYSIMQESGVDSYAFVDELAASACYGLACVCDEVIIHPEANAGSIGALICLLDQSKAMEMEGLKEIYITSTPGKVPFAADGSFRESFLAKLQEDVTKLGDKFVAHVSKYTGLSVEDIKAMDAQVFDAETCLSNGLANSVMNHSEFSEYISSKYA